MAEIEQNDKTALYLKLFQTILRENRIKEEKEVKNGAMIRSTSPVQIGYCGLKIFISPKRNPGTYIRNFLTTVQKRVFRLHWTQSRRRSLSLRY